MINDLFNFCGNCDCRSYTYDKELGQSKFLVNTKYTSQVN